MIMKCKCSAVFDSGELTLQDFQAYDVTPMCDACEAVEVQKQEKALKIRKAKEIYESQVCLEFRNTDKTHAGYSKNLEKRLFECHQANPSSIGIIGKSGVSKSRVMAMLARDFAWKGKSFLWVNSVEYRQACDKEFDDELGYKSKKLLRAVKLTDNLFFDDIGALAGTNGVIKNLHDMLEYRGNRMLPMFWTSNETGNEMLAGREVPIKVRERIVSRIEGKSHVIYV